MLGRAINWKNVAKFAAALALALGTHWVTPDAMAQGIADTIAVILAQANRRITRPEYVDPE